MAKIGIYKYETFCYLKFCHNRINPLGSSFEPEVCARWPSVYLPISIPRHFFPTPISFLKVVAVHFSSFIFIVCSLPFFFWPQYTNTCHTWSVPQYIKKMLQSDRVDRASCHKGVLMHSTSIASNSDGLGGIQQLRGQNFVIFCPLRGQKQPSPL